MRRTALPTVVGLGRLVDLTVRQADGPRQRAVPTATCWLAWCERTRDLVVVRPGRGPSVTVDDPAASHRHRAFHGAAPAAARVMEMPAARGRLQTVGLIEAITYCADAVDSPSKRAFYWHHRFGDRGERGHGPDRTDAAAYPDRFLPALTIDAAGGWFITRRPQNRYRVQDWIIG
jgi:hypothetical protein